MDPDQTTARTARRRHVHRARIRISDTLVVQAEILPIRLIGACQVTMCRDEVETVRTRTCLHSLHLRLAGQLDLRCLSLSHNRYPTTRLRRHR